MRSLNAKNLVGEHRVNATPMSDISDDNGTFTPRSTRLHRFR